MSGTGTRHILFPFLARQWRALLVAGLATVIVAAAEVLRPFPLKLVIDHLFAGGTVSSALGPEEILLLAGIAVFVLAVALLEAGGSYLMDVRLMRAGERIVHDLRIAIYEHLQRLSLGFHQRRHTGDLVTRVTGDVNAVGTFFSSSLATMVSSGLTLIGMVVVGFLLDPVLAVLAFATAPLIGLVAFRFRRRMGTLQRRQRQMEGEIASLATESLSSIQQVKALGSERFEHERLEQKSEERRDAGYEASMVEGSFTRLIDIVGAIGTAVVLVAGVVRVGEGLVSPGDLVVMVTYVRRVYRPLRAMAREWVRFQRTIARAERVAELLASDDILVDRPTTVVPQPLRGALQFDGVSFSYEGGRPALTDVSLAIPAGERVGIVGRSGAGKSTLAALAARFYDPSAGRVLIDGTDARDYPLAWLRGQVGLVLQDAVLFTGSVADNIGWGLDASREEVIRAARAVGADGFIEKLPDGYDTLLDPAGAGLSGGQRQRIAIARTLLRDPQILLLDEPTTGLDADSEAEVLAGLDVLMRGRTTVIISHALALAQRADQVIVLEGGRVVQAGPPSDLLGRHGRFRDLVAEQESAEPPGRLSGRGSSAPAVTDPRLPQARLLLDTSAVAPMLERSFDRGTRLNVDIRYLRYKPGTNLVVHYDVAANGHRYDAVGMIAAGQSLSRRAQAPENLALAQLVSGRVEAASPLAYDRDLGTLFQWYPLDLELPTLAWPPSELRRQMSAAGVPVPVSDEEPERLAYKPRRRAVLRVDSHVVKLYRRQAEFERALAGQQAAATLDSVVAPRLEAVMHEHLVTVQSLLEGVSADAANEAAAAGALLARLHRSDPAGLPIFEPRSQLAAAAASARLVWTIAPELRPRLERLMAALAAGMPEIPELVPSHGDFNARQLLVMGDGPLALTDFDEFCLAPAALDPATYAAYFVLGRPGDLASARAALDELCRGYGGRPRHLDWYFATMILRRSARPFRYFEPEWPQRVEAMVGAAEEVAAGGEIAPAREAPGG